MNCNPTLLPKKTKKQCKIWSLMKVEMETYYKKTKDSEIISYVNSNSLETSSVL